MSRVKKITQSQLNAAFLGAYRLEAQQAKRPCSGCAFADAEAWVANPAMGHSILACLTKPSAHQFFCHDNLPKGGASGNSYQLPLLHDGTPDVAQLQRCGGFLRWAVKYRLASFVVQWKAVMALQLQMCRRFLKGDFPHAAEFRQSCGGRADVLQEALNMQSLMACSDDE